MDSETIRHVRELIRQHGSDQLLSPAMLPTQDNAVSIELWDHPDNRLSMVHIVVNFTKQQIEIHHNATLRFIVPLPPAPEGFQASMVDMLADDD